MKKKLRRSLSIVLSLAMVITSLNISNTTAKAADETYINMMADAEYNLALNKDVVLNQRCSEGALANINNGSISGAGFIHCAINKDNDNENDLSATIDLGGYYNASAIDEILIIYKDNNSNDTVLDGTYSIAYSVDGEMFTDIVANKAVKEFQTFDGEAVKNATLDDVSDASGVVRYIKVSYPKKPTYGIHISELAVLDTDKDGELLTYENINPVTNLSVVSPYDLTMSISFDASTTAGVTYEVYANNKLILDNAVAGQENVINGIAVGEYEVKVVAKNVNGFVSPATIGTVTVDGPASVLEMTSMKKYNLALNKSFSISSGTDLNAVGSSIETGSNSSKTVALTNGYVGRNDYVTSPKVAGAWFTIDLGKTYDASTLDEVTVWMRYEDVGNSSGPFEVQYSEDGKTFNTVATVDNDSYRAQYTANKIAGNDGKNVHYIVADVSGQEAAPVKYVRVLFITAIGWGAQTSEIAVMDTNKDAKEYTPGVEVFAPTISATSPAYNTISYTITEPEQADNYTYEVTFNGEKTTVAAGTNTIENVAAGTYTVSVRSVDANGNKSSIVTSEEVTVENKPVEEPSEEPTSDNPGENPGDDPTVDFTYTHATATALPAVDGMTDYTDFEYVSATATSGNAMSAIDNNENSRWESAKSDPQSITVNLGSVYAIDRIDIRWETASSKDFEIQVSSDGVNYTKAATVENAAAGANRLDTITFANSVNAKYVKIYGTARTTDYGHSIYEMAIYGQDEFIQPFILTPVTSAYIYNAVDAGKGYQVAFKDGNKFDRVEGDSYTFEVTVNNHKYTVNKSKEYIDLSDAGLTIGQKYTGTIVAKYVDPDGITTVSDSATTATFTYTEEATEAYDTGIAKVFVNTARTAATNNINMYTDTSKTKVDAGVVVKDATGKVNVSDFATINVRGNTTSIAQKKPYNIKFDSKQNVLGMGKAKKWSLLANCFDKTLMRNQIGFTFHNYLESTHLSGQTYSSMFAPVDLYIDGKCLGSYLLVESVETGETRVNLDEENTENIEMLLEIDNASRDVASDSHLASVNLNEEGALESYQIYKSSLNMIFTVNEPGEDGTANKDAYEAYLVKYADKHNGAIAFLDDFETALKAKDFETMKQFMDVESFVDFYITSELFKTKDIGFSSTRYYIKNDEEGNPMLYAGPLWDLDLSSGNAGDSPGYTEFYAQNANPWFGALMKVPEFKAAVVARWAEILPTAVNLYKKGGTIDQAYNQLKKSADVNYGNAYNVFAEGDNKEIGWQLMTLYGASHTPGQNVHGSSVLYDNYEAYVSEYKTWVKNRVNWLSSQWAVENVYDEVVLRNIDGNVTLSWDNVDALSYDITYTVYNPEGADTEKTVTVDGNTTSLVIEEVLQNDTDVKVTANYEDETSEIIGTKKALADLVITGFTFSKKTPIIGDKVMINLIVKNIGCAVAIPPNNNVLTSMTYIDGKSIGYTDTYRTPLLPGAIADYNFAKEWTATEGEHELSALINERHNIAEVSEGNNTFKTTIRITNAVPPEIPTGLIDASTAEMPYYFTWTGSEDAVTYNIYVNGEKVGTTETESYQIPEEAFGGAGEHVVTVTAANEDAESDQSEGVTVTVLERITLKALTKAYIYNAVDAGKGYQVVFSDKNDLTGQTDYTYSFIVTVNGKEYTVSKSKAYIDLSDAGLTVGEKYTGTIVAKFVYDDGRVVESDPVTTAKFTYTEEAVVPYDTGIPQVFVSTARTADTENVNLFQDTSKTKVDSSVVMKNADGTVDTANFGTFNVRGNTTSMAQKKAFNIKFDSKQNVFGMGSAKKWSLLANCFDKTLMRNQVAFTFHDYLESLHESGQAFSSKFIPVDLYVDGHYLGSYLLIESVEAGSTRVDIDAENVENTELLLEIDNASRDVASDAHLANVEIAEDGTLGLYEIYKSGLNMIFTVNEPGEDGTANMEAYNKYLVKYADKLNKTTAFLDGFEEALKAKDFETMCQYMDLESFVDFYITSELFKTKDIGFSSTRYYVKEDGEGNPKLYAGPLWDLDLSSGNAGDSPGYTEFYAQNANPWFGAMMKVSEFKAAVVARWAEILPTVTELYKKGGTIDQTYNQLKKSADANYSVAYNEFATTEDKNTGWVLTALYGASHGLNENVHGSKVIYNTYEEYVAEYKTWVKNRVAWLSSQWGVDNTYDEVQLNNVDGAVTLSWESVDADSFDITYTTYDGNTEKTVNIAGDANSYVFEDLLANNTEVKLVANFEDETSEVVDTKTALADLVISNIIPSKAKPLQGDAVTFTLEVKNMGCAVAVPDTDVVSSITYINGASIGYTVEFKKPVNPNAIADFGFAKNWTATEPGIYTVSAEIDERNHVVESKEGNNTFEKTIKVYTVEELSTADMKITGFQMSTTLGENKDQVGIRTVYQIEGMVEGQTTTEVGLVIGLKDGLTDPTTQMVLNPDTPYAFSSAATDLGKMETQMGDSATATYYSMTMPIGNGYNVNYCVRPYAVLADGSVVYGDVEELNIYEIAKNLYENNKMSTATAHNALYEVIKKVDPEAEEVDYTWAKTLIEKDAELEAATSTDVDVTGFQMSSALNGIAGNMGLRIVYSVDGEYEEAGLIYGLVYGNEPITSADMTLEKSETEKYVTNYAATEKGLLDVSFGSQTADYYATTMSVSSGKKNVYYTTTYFVRAYAKLADGTVKYSGVYSYTINDVAEALYNNDLMSTYAGHEALYTNILTKVDADHAVVDYGWDKTLVD